MTVTSDLELLRQWVHGQEDCQPALERVARVVDGLLDDIWNAYLMTGADPDGETGWRCEPAQAGATLIYAVRTLRLYADAIEEQDS